MAERRHTTQAIYYNTYTYITLYATPKDILYLMNAAHGRILSYRSIAPQK